MARDCRLDHAVKTQLIRETIQLVRLCTNGNRGCSARNADLVRIAPVQVDPLPFDRAAVLSVLQRRLDESSRRVSVCANPELTARDQLNKDLTAILGGRRPRKYGELPQNMGLYSRIYPGGPAAAVVDKLRRRPPRKKGA